MRRYNSVRFLAAFLTCLTGCVGNDPIGSQARDSAAAGNGNGTQTPPSSPAVNYPFEAVAPQSYVNKIKMVLTGLPASDAEIAIGSTTNGLSQLVDTLMASSAYQTSIMQFFSWSTQQSQVTSELLEVQLSAGNGLPTWMMQDVHDMFAQTAVYMAQNNVPFNQITTTKQFMMTVPLMAIYGMLEDLENGDLNPGRVDFYEVANPNFNFRLTSAGGPIPTAASSSPADPNYMVYYVPTLTTNCSQSITPTLTVNKYNRVDSTSFDLFQVLWLDIAGYGFSIYQKQPAAATENCRVMMPADPSIVTDADHAWRLITIRQPQAGEQPTPFWDIDTLRSTSTLIMRVPRVGFWTTPAFLAQWQTNANNQSRVTMNQTLIGALGKAFDGTDKTTPISTAAIDATHSVPGSACYTCHSTMDPMRQFFRQTYSTAYDVQDDPNMQALPGVWAHDGQSSVGTSIYDLGAALSLAPEFALAWTQRVCTWVNSSVCDTTDPELQRIAKDFQASNFSFNAMLKEVLVSPLTTYASSTLTAVTRNTVMSIARRDQLCNILSSRLNIADMCGLNANTPLSGNRNNMKGLLVSYPADGYSRGSLVPNQVTDPGLVTRMGLESVCGYASMEVVDNGSTSPFLSSDPNAAIGSMVGTLMGLDTTRGAPFTQILTSHYRAAVTGGMSPTNALRSTFVLGCLSPQVAMVGL